MSCDDVFAVSVYCTEYIDILWYIDITVRWRVGQNKECTKEVVTVITTIINFSKQTNDAFMRYQYCTGADLGGVLRVL